MTKSVGVLLVFAWLLVGCLDTPAGKSSPDLAAVKATAQIAQANQSAVEFQVTQTAQQKMDARTDAADKARTSVQATLDANTISAQATTTARGLALQATQDANTLRESNARAQIVEDDAQIKRSEAQVKQAEAISATRAITLAMTINEQANRRDLETRTSPAYVLIDWLYYAIPRLLVGLGLPLILFAILWRVGRTIARWFEKRFEINGMTYILTAEGPIPLLPPPASVIENGELETGNTETLGNTGNSDGNTASASVSSPEVPELLPTYNQGHPAHVLRMTHEEREEMLMARNDAIGLLAKCLDYYKTHPTEDPGIIPRYDAIGMHAESRGQIVDNLEYSGCVSKVKNKKTFVVPEIGTCAVLFELIRSNQKRVYPVGYHERRRSLLDNAVQGLAPA